MRSLIQILFNVVSNMYHPIYYLEKPFPGRYEDQDKTIIRYRSKGHHTTGFNLREDALKDVESMKKKLEEQGYIVTIEVEKDVDWNGSDDDAVHTVIRP